MTTLVPILDNDDPVEEEEYEDDESFFDETTEVLANFEEDVAIDDAAPTIDEFTRDEEDRDDDEDNADFDEAPFLSVGDPSMDEGCRMKDAG